MKRFYQQNYLKLTAVSFVLLLIASALTLKVTVSANKTAADQSSNSESNFKIQDEKVRQILESPIFTEFDAWSKQYLERNLNGDAEQTKRGETLAVKRRELFKELIRLDPQAALEKAISVETYKRLPSTVAENSEKRISAYGDFLVYVFDEIDHTTG